MCLKSDTSLETICSKHTNTKYQNRCGTRRWVSLNTLVYLLFFLVLLPVLSMNYLGVLGPVTMKMVQLLWKTKSGLAHTWNALENYEIFVQLKVAIMAIWPKSGHQQKDSHRPCKNVPNQMKIVATVVKMAQRLWLKFSNFSSAFYAISSPDFDFQSNWATFLLGSGNRTKKNRYTKVLTLLPDL